ncbi:DUF6385 domain-containing protein [Desulforamulus hydrothermalis]|uniref:DUF6385 domain-containing protein n=1 Tax=Desulforamulus hydrothermalis Lam5 = DSM 18033 TaxID=1121428 RepID=K8E0F5_9FIRM|nr:DUF6385 domain-containing protein [Desulforamulus hydrothermalis]CCO09054.1 conserved hypothetical protein [Desulforamulus hydrothermalis Lam5 = DSM 18033]SHG77991.1 hypothetical protein SAMN02745177_00372 [Desulforamulus hydrothermalis Lam5 = DSM 18033]
MPNFSVFNLDADVLRTKIFGSENTAIRTDADGRLEIRNISDPVTVTATNLDIRDLSANQDNLLAFGFDGADVQPVRTDADGRLEIRNISDPVTVTGSIQITPTFTEINYIDVDTDDSFTGLDYVDTSTQNMYTFYVYNKGDNPVDIRLDISPDQVTYFTDVAARTLTSGTTDTFVAKTFLRYTRIAYKSTLPGNSTTIDVFFQTQAI